MEIVYVSVRVLHVLFGVFWAGAAFLVVLFLEPSIRDAGPAGGQVLGGLVRRGYLRFVSVVALVNVLTGLWLLWVMSGRFSPGFMGSTSGMLLSTGMLTGLLALGVGVHMVHGSVRRLTALEARRSASATPSSADEDGEVAQLQRKVRIFTRIGALLLLVSVVTMALGPHV